MKHSDSAAKPGLWWHSWLEIQLPQKLWCWHQFEIHAQGQKARKATALFRNDTCRMRENRWKSKPRRTTPCQQLFSPTLKANPPAAFETMNVHYHDTGQLQQVQVNTVQVTSGLQTNTKGYSCQAHSGTKRISMQEESIRAQGKFHLSKPTAFEQSIASNAESFGVHWAVPSAQVQCSF